MTCQQINVRRIEWLQQSWVIVKLMAQVDQKLIPSTV